MKIVISLTILLVSLSASHVANAQTGDAPEISRSPGVAGGVVLLWPRIIPRSQTAATRQLAREVQAYLKKLIERNLPGRPLDIRPEPERICPRAGCQAMSVGVLLARKGAGCIAVALLSRPGQTLTRLVPWVGKVRLKKEWIEFRKPPESHISIQDFARCADLLKRLPDKEVEISKMLKAAEPQEKKKSGKP